MAADQMTVSVWRGGPGGGDFKDYAVPRFDNQTVLDVVAWIQQETDPTLSYRFACRVGMCGSCGMVVNGVPRWTCRTHVQRVLEANRIEIAPLRNLPVIKDLAVDMDPFFEKWIAAEGRFHASKSRRDDVQEVVPDTEERAAVDAGIECINCSVCYAACDTVAGNPDFLGPAALNRAWTLFNDVKNDGREAILDAVSHSGGCHSCHSMGNCSQHCPNDLNPMQAIAGLKRATVRRALGGR
ncbi:MAG: 2Fe-2S iron-sulfur cluster-binding protein [Pseudomonadota bacterium]